MAGLLGLAGLLLCHTSRVNHPHTSTSLPLPLPAPQVKMVTGDQHAIAVETSRRLGMGTNIMEGAELLQGQHSAALGDKVGWAGLG